jgi:AcrR family transcriptional regulator
MQGNREQSRARILSASLDLLLQTGPGGWTLEAVANRARCAKGLVLYHFGSKDELLASTAEQLARQRLAARVEALAPGGATGLDRLWQLLLVEIADGQFRLWLTLLADPRTQPLVGMDPASRHTLAVAAATALDLPTSTPGLRTLPSALDGFQIALFEKEDQTVVREAYDRWWLDLVAEA